MSHLKPARPAAEDSRAHARAMSFGFSETLPSVNWLPPGAELLYHPTVAAAANRPLDLPALESAWAETERMGL